MRLLIHIFAIIGFISTIIFLISAYIYFDDWRQYPGNVTKRKENKKQSDEYPGAIKIGLSNGLCANRLHCKNLDGFDCRVIPSRGCNFVLCPNYERKEKK